MPRQARVDIAGEVFHVINRANARLEIFSKQGDFEAVLNSLLEIKERFPIVDIFSFSIMPNHWHFSARPKRDGDLGIFFGKFTQVVTQRWHAAHQTTGSGHLFQGRFKSFLVGRDSYFLWLMRYIEANPLRAKLVQRAENWPWGSLYIREKNPKLAEKLLSFWPSGFPTDYLEVVNKELPEQIIEDIRSSARKGRPFGDDLWVGAKIDQYSLEHTVRDPWRPGKSGT